MRARRGIHRLQQSRSVRREPHLLNLQGALYRRRPQCPPVCQAHDHAPRHDPAHARYGRISAASHVPRCQRSHYWHGRDRQQRHAHFSRWLGPHDRHGNPRQQRHDNVPGLRRPHYWHSFDVEALNLAAAEVVLLATIAAHPALTTSPVFSGRRPGKRSTRPTREPSAVTLQPRGTVEV
jgi:hypothetical protein